MAIEYLKKASKTSTKGEDETRKIVSNMLAEIEAGDEDVARAYSNKLDGWDAHIVVDAAAIQAAASQVFKHSKNDLQP